MSSDQSRPKRPTRPPPLQTLVYRPSTAPGPSTPTSAGSGPPKARFTSPTSDTLANQEMRSHQNFVLADPVAFHYLAEDSMTTIVEQRTELKGYQCYVVEQWATSRSNPTFTIVTYTGDQSHSAIVGVLSVPTDESTWSPRLRVYFKELNQYHAKRSETPLGILMVTSLASFHSSLTLISIPDGNLSKHRRDFFVNEDLKRLGCSGRVGLNLAPPAGATVAKFQQLYHTSDKNDIYKSVIGLVKLCQTALMLFDKLEEDYADGLLCDVTERAINDWWKDIGASFYHVEPHDGILGPTTVAALLGLLMGARNRLHSLNAPVAKDAFDAEAMKRGVAHFQKQQRLGRTRRLDRRTLERLHQSTERHADHGRLALPKAVKSTVAELSGKGGEMVMDAVGRRDRAGIAEIETVDMERFIQLLSGARPKWLWYGKPLKNSKDMVLQLGLGYLEESNSTTVRDGEQSGFAWAGRRGASDDQPIVNKASFEEPRNAGPDDTHDTEDGRFKPTVKRSTGLKEAKAGVNRLKDAVRLGGHHDQRNSQKGSKDEQSPSSPQSPVVEESEKRRRPLMLRAQTSPSNPSQSPRSMLNDERPESTAGGDPLSRFRFPMNIDERSAPPYTAEWNGSMVNASSGRLPAYAASDRPTEVDTDLSQTNTNQTFDTMSDANTTAVPSIAGSVYRDVNLDEALPSGPETEQGIGKLLRRTLSYSQCAAANFQTRSNDAYPRHLSFSLAEESVLTWKPIVEYPSSATVAALMTLGTPAQQLVNEDFFAQEAKHLRHHLSTLTEDIVPWTDSQIAVLGGFLERADGLEGTFNELYQPRSDGVQAIHASSETMMREQTEILLERRKEIETLAAKLEYEIDGLKGRVEDVGAGVQDFRNGVQRVEERVRELEKDQERAERGWACAVM